MKNVPLYIDLAFCFIFLPLMILIFPVERWLDTYPVFVCSFVLWLYITYFLNRRITVPLLFRHRRQRACGLCIMLVSLTLTYAMSCYEVSSPLYHLYEHVYPRTMVKVRLNQQAVWLLYVVVATFSFAVGMLTEINRQRQEREEIEYERNKAELALYKAQINPHFLFNTLNTLYGLLIMHSDKTEVTMERFINLTKYMYNNANREFIAISEEVEYIDQYIALQALRLNEYADISFTHRIESPEMPIPPMLLITFIENAFKYSISSNEPCFIRIRLNQQGDNLCFEVDNTVFEREMKNSKRMGIENCRKRLSLLYPERHHLVIGKDKDNIFHVRLELQSESL
ncbi:sensor histidine kinase [Odoribacter sp. AF15-53]|nr:sensor histidine kinase [Odoribacter sp. AF15-53]